MKFTKITSSLPETITKKIELVDGKLKKTAAANMVEGKAEVVAVSSLTEFAQELMSTDSSTAFVYGIPNAGDCQLLTKGEYEKRGRPKGFSPRTNDAFRWNAGPSIMFLDYDAAPGEEPMSREDLVASLEHACPGILDAGYIWTTSASAGILDGDGNDLTGISGQRIYIPVKSGLDIPRAAEVLEEKLWNASLGRIEIAKNGAMLKRSLFDFAVYQQSRLDFVGPADLQPPLNQKPKLPMVVERGQLLDTAKVIKHRVQKDAKDAEALVAKAKADATPEAEAVRGAYIDHRSEREASKLGVPVEQVRERLEKLLVGGELSSDFVLFTREGNVTVAEAMADAKWDGVQCLDPAEPDYRGGDYCGIIHVDENPLVYSLAHGGRTFPFSKVGESEEVPTEVSKDLYCLVDNKGNATYMMEGGEGEFSNLKRDIAKRELERRDVDGDAADELLDYKQVFEPLRYAGEFAGLSKGVHKVNGARILVTREHKTIQPKQGDWSLLADILGGMFKDDENLNRALAYMYFAWESLDSGEWCPLPALVVSGPHGCGKSLFIEILREVLGGYPRADAFQFLSGQTSFNRDLVGSVLLCCDDEMVSRDRKSRDAMGSAFKKCAVSNSNRIEGKGLDAFTANPHWRLIVACNDEHENLLVLPEVNESMEDKFLLLHCIDHEMPENPKTGAERKAFFQRIVDCIPGFLWWMQNECAWRGEFEDKRMQITGWQDPALLQKLNGLSSEWGLLEMLDMIEPWNGSADGFWEGTSSEMQSLLAGDDRTRQQAGRLFSYPAACGRFLGHLADRLCPERVQRSASATGRHGVIWRLFPS